MDSDTRRTVRIGALQRISSYPGALSSKARRISQPAVAGGIYVAQGASPGVRISSLSPAPLPCPSPARAGEGCRRRGEGRLPRAYALGYSSSAPIGASGGTARVVATSPTSFYSRRGSAPLLAHGRRFGRRDLQPHLEHGAAVGLDHLETHSVLLELLARRGDVTQMREQQSSDC